MNPYEKKLADDLVYKQFTMCLPALNVIGEDWFKGMLIVAFTYQNPLYDEMNLMFIDALNELNLEEKSQKPTEYDEAKKTLKGVQNGN